MPLRRSHAWLLVTAGWALFGVVCGLQVWLSMITHGHSLARMTLFYVSVWALWIPATFAVGALARRLPLVPVRRMAVLIHLLVACVWGVVHAALWVQLTLLLVPYDRMNPTSFTRAFTSTAFFQMPTELVLYALVALSAHALDYYARDRAREVRSAQLESSLAEARLHALELQIQPHFLFNTLNAVSALVRTGQPKDAVRMIGGLSDLLRYVLDRSGGQRVRVEEEAEMLRQYLEIQRLRFPDRLTYEIEVAPEARRAAVPVLLLQPLAENAIRHGIAGSTGAGRVHLRVFRQDDTLRVEMQNSGRLGDTHGRGIGIANTVARLEQLYGEHQAFELTGESDGVMARVTIPWSEVA
jgi:two-component system LytT family sensor kinase